MAILPPLHHDLHPGPFGTLALTAEPDGRLVGVDFSEDAQTEPQETRQRLHRPSTFSEVHRQLEAYEQGRRKTFDLPLHLEGSAFQVAVWRILLTIPFGATWSYGQVAAAVGNPRAARAVGAACGANRLALVVPCHRVIGSSGGLTGFGGGLTLKRHLLEHEARCF